MIYGFVLAGLMIPPAVVPTIWVLQCIGLFKTIHGMILIQVAYGLAFTVLLYRAFIATIPRDLDEAARIDGAKPWQIFFRVVLPLLKPVTVTVIVVQSIAIFNDFTHPLYYLPGQENVTVQLTLYNFQSQFTLADEPSVHEHPARHHPAAHRLHLLQPPDRRGHDRRRGQGLIQGETQQWPTLNCRRHARASARVDVIKGIDLVDREGRVRGLRRALGLRQVHAAADDRRARGRDLGHDPRSTART